MFKTRKKIINDRRDFCIKLVNQLDKDPYLVKQEIEKEMAGKGPLKREGSHSMSIEKLNKMDDRFFMGYYHDTLREIWNVADNM